MNDTLMQQCRREAEERYPTTEVKEPGGGYYFYVQCNNGPCSFVFLSRDCDGCQPIADTGDFSEMQCPSCGIIADDECYERAVINAARSVYASALYHERSKRPPTVEGPPMITVDEAMAIAWPWIMQTHGGIAPPTGAEADLRARLTAAATNNTNDNG